MTDKGFKLDSIYFAYEVETAGITSLTPRLTKKTWSISSPTTAVSLTNIAYIDGNLLTSGLIVDEHYRYITITNPEYLNSESVINLEIELVTPATSVFKFYGIMLHYTYSLY